MLNLVRRLARRHLALLGVSAAVLGILELIIPAVIATLDMPNLLGGVLAMLPPAVGVALGEQFFGGLSANGLLGFGWNHPIAHAAGTAVAVVLGARAVAGEADNGTLELVLAQPISRARYLWAHIAFATLALLLLCAAGAIASIAGTRIFSVTDLAPLRIGRVAANFFLLLAAVYSTTLLVSVFAREVGHVLGAGFVLALGSFLIYTVALLWSAAAFLEPFTLHAYYAPRDVLVTGGIPLQSIAVLGGWTVAALLLAFWHFARRDVP